MSSQTPPLPPLPFQYPDFACPKERRNVCYPFWLYPVTVGTYVEVSNEVLSCSVFNFFFFLLCPASVFTFLRLCGEDPPANMPLFGKSHKSPTDIVKTLKDNLGILVKQDKKTDKVRQSRYMMCWVAGLVDQWVRHPTDRTTRVQFPNPTLPVHVALGKSVCKIPVKFIFTL